MKHVPRGGARASPPDPSLVALAPGSLPRRPSAPGLRDAATVRFAAARLAAAQLCHLVGSFIIGLPPLIGGAVRLAQQQYSAPRSMDTLCPSLIRGAPAPGSSKALCAGLIRGAVRRAHWGWKEENAPNRRHPTPWMARSRRVEG